ncbi:uncharacterized protein LOC127556518 [Antechinus flavipes]|uniref:uncharacterized protein LOC127556518 n=1 Tax=Antechinus flavipes TaxID=38775 RepID=UPI002235ADCF|nr:uncharacterized protein LOC127556518 [Antechinus flavipes]
MGSSEGPAPPCALGSCSCSPSSCVSPPPPLVSPVSRFLSHFFLNLSPSPSYLCHSTISPCPSSSPSTVLSSFPLPSTVSHFSYFPFLTLFLSSPLCFIHSLPPISLTLVPPFLSLSGSPNPRVSLCLCLLWSQTLPPSPIPKSSPSPLPASLPLPPVFPPSLLSSLPPSPSPALPITQWQQNRILSSPGSRAGSARPPHPLAPDPRLLGPRGTLSLSCQAQALGSPNCPAPPSFLRHLSSAPGFPGSPFPHSGGLALQTPAFSSPPLSEPPTPIHLLHWPPSPEAQPLGQLALPAPPFRTPESPPRLPLHPPS